MKEETKYIFRNYEEEGTLKWWLPKGEKGIYKVTVKKLTKEEYRDELYGK